MSVTAANSGGGFDLALELERGDLLPGRRRQADARRHGDLAVRRLDLATGPVRDVAICSTIEV